MISIRMIKICGESISKPLQMIFKSCIQNGTFPNEWRKANIPIHKKGDTDLFCCFRFVERFSTDWYIMN